MKYTLHYLLLFSIALFFVSCEKEPIEDDEPHDYFEDPIDEIDNLTSEEKVLALVNQVRSQGCHCGGAYFSAVSPVTLDNQLNEAAERHSQDMYDNSFFDHTGSDGSNFATRIRDAGYDYISASENIASGQTSEQQVVNSWLDSPGHCENIMSDNKTHMGVSRIGNYWTQVFGKK